jgi:TRAP-type C4-dicarboxylate transport system permease large subunit
MNVRLIALLTAILPLLAVHGTYLVAASHGQVEWCIPYIDSCTSISATGRNPPASYLFRATMLPSAAIMIVYWWFNYAWLNALHRKRGDFASRTNLWMLALGVVACLGLILYITVLGESGSAWARQRRIGTALFFSFTYVAQLLFLRQLHQLRSQLRQVPDFLLRAMLATSVLLLVLGVMTLVFDAWDELWYDTVEDAFEWNLTLLLQVNFLLGYFVWRRAGWFLSVEAGRTDHTG